LCTLFLYRKSEVKQEKEEEETVEVTQSGVRVSGSDGERGKHQNLRWVDLSELTLAQSPTGQKHIQTEEGTAGTQAEKPN